MAAKYKNLESIKEQIASDPSAFFLYEDNLQHRDTEDKAWLRKNPKAIGFVTKKAPDDQQNSCFTPQEYSKVFFKIIGELKKHIVKYSQHTFYIPRLCTGLSNKYLIWELVMKHNFIQELGEYDNVVFCWDENE